MKVYIIEYQVDYEGSEIKYIFKNKEDAIKKLEEISKIENESGIKYRQLKKMAEDWFEGNGNSYNIQEYEVL